MSKEQDSRGIKMGFHTVTGGRRGVRLKREIYIILQEAQEGMTTRQIYEKLCSSPCKRFINGTVQVAQHLKRMKGVEQDLGMAFGLDSQYSAKLWILRYPEEFIEWFGEEIP